MKQINVLVGDGTASQCNLLFSSLEAIPLDSRHLSVVVEIDWVALAAGLPPAICLIMGLCQFWSMKLAFHQLVHRLVIP